MGYQCTCTRRRFRRRNAAVLRANAIIPDKVKERAATRYRVSGSCHISTYSTGSHGYAQIGWQIDRKTIGTTAHRAAWELLNGPIPEGMTIDHTCKERRCVNVNHMRLLSNFENARRTSGRDWKLGSCANGHPNSELHTQPSGKRVCPSCRREWTARYNRRRALRLVGDC